MGIIAIRLTEDDKRIIENKANDMRLSVSAYCRMVILNKIENEKS